MDTLEVLDGGGATQVEQIAADADVASAKSLAGGDVGEGVFDGGAAPQQGAARSGLLELSELSLAGFVGGDGHGAAIARMRPGCTWRAGGTRRTLRGRTRRFRRARTALPRRRGK